jgi:hypothetical protein
MWELMDNTVLSTLFFFFIVNIEEEEKCTEETKIVLVYFSVYRDIWKWTSKKVKIKKK